jgi:aryl-alcohol dehydrogenase (NADP+)
MEYVNLGPTGIKVSRLCLGCMSYGARSWQDWVLEDREARPYFERAFEMGINFFDTADVYSLGESERILGRVLKDMKIDRETVVIATKVFNAMGKDRNQRGLSKKHIRHAIDASLERLGVDYVDLYQIHRFDPATPMEETLEALSDVVAEGKALHIGASSMHAWQFAKFLYLAEKHGLERFVTMQNQYNLVYREEEREMIPLCREEKIGLIPWSPMARGFLAGNRRRQDYGETSRAKNDERAKAMYYHDDDFTVVDRVGEIAARYGVSNAQVALAWVLHQPGITAPIIGATKPHHLPEAEKAMSLKLSAEDLKALTETYRPHPVLF